MYIVLKYTRLCKKEINKQEIDLKKSLLKFNELMEYGLNVRYIRKTHL